jgi:hypothetical protein
MPHNKIAEMLKCETHFGSAIGHIGGRWRKELVQPSSISKFRGSVREA